MREMKRPSIEGKTTCHHHGELGWSGDVRCALCHRIHLCEEREDKRIYASVPDDGFCACGSALFPDVAPGAALVGADAWKASAARACFSAQPLCASCGKAYAAAWAASAKAAADA
jgi:hypothetical protein